MATTENVEDYLLSDLEEEQYFSQEWFMVFYCIVEV